MNKAMCDLKFILLGLVFLFSSDFAVANDCKSFFTADSRQLAVIGSVDPTEILDPNASTYELKPAYHPDSPLAANVRLTFMRHKFARAFTFSRDGKFVAIHHDIYPDAEQVTLRSLETAENLSSIYWKGKGERLFDIKSLTFDGDKRQIVGLAENFFYR